MERPFPGRDDIAALRRRIAAIEGRPTEADRLDLDAGGPPRAAGPTPGAGPDGEAGAGEAGAGAPVDMRLALPFRVAAVDRCFRAGGLPLGALHEVAAPEAREAGTLAGFAAALAARLVVERAGIVVWASDRTSPREGGRLDPHGLNGLGLDPGRVVLVEAGDAGEVLWTLEEALAARGVAAAIGEIRGTPRALDLTATRRLALRARDRPVLGLLLRSDAPPEPTAAATRWRVAARPAGTLAGFPDGVGRPVWRVELDKNRDGRLGGWELEWDHHERRFARLAPHPVARPAAPHDRPADPGRTGRVVALRRVS